MSLKVDITQKTPGIIIMSFTGPIDATTQAIFQKEVDSVLDMSPKVLIFDFAGVTFINSSGLGMIFKAKKVLAKTGEFSLANLQPQIQTVLDIMKALPNQQVFASTKEMDSYLAHVQRKIIKNKKSP